MRSALNSVVSFTRMCERVFGPNFSMAGKPDAQTSTIMGGGKGIQGTHIFAANGSEDPWQWATIQTNNTALNQIARTSDCPTCGHCCELHTPKEDDAANLKETRTMIADWVTTMLATQFPPTFNTTAALQ